MPLTSASSFCSRSGLGCSRLLCLGLQNPAQCRWSSSSSGSDRSPLAVGVQLPLLWDWVKPVPAQAWMQLRPGGSSWPCFMVEVAGGSLEESQKHSCFFVVIHRNCFRVELPGLPRVISWNLYMRPLQFPSTLSLLLPLLPPCPCSCPCLSFHPVSIPASPPRAVLATLPAVPEPFMSPYNKSYMVMRFRRVWKVTQAGEGLCAASAGLGHTWLFEAVLFLRMQHSVNNTCTN